MIVFFKIMLWMWLDCIFVGEVCGLEVFDLFMVWNIGYEGGVVMLYVNNVEVGLSWFVFFISMYLDFFWLIEFLIGDVVYLIVYIVCMFEGWRIESIFEVGGFVDGNYWFCLL